MSVSEILKKLRAEHNLSIRKLESLSGVAKSTISDIENGGNTSTITLQKLAEALGVSVEEFFKEDSEYAIGENSKVSVIAEKNINLDIIPEQFTNPEPARAYVKKHKIFASEGFNADKLSDEEILDFANALLEQMRLVSYKYKK